MSQAENFDNVIDYFKGLGLIRTTESTIIESDNLKRMLDKNGSDEGVIKNYLLEKSLNSTNSFSSEVYRYLKNFRVSKENMFEYKPTTEARLRESGIRNLFVELDLVKYDKRKNNYKIMDNYLAIFARYLETKKVTQKELSYLIIKKEELGLAAELEILQYEKKRLVNHPELLEHLKHVSQSDVNAGYDIMSYEIESSNKETVQQRYIEVKAVSKLNYKFTWTRGEIDTSKALSGQYYLYLLPVISNKKFDIAGLIIIKNPYVEVFKNRKKWQMKEEQYSFWKQT
ncbi:MAG: DUF3883 domain-containing protein [Thermodesulfobacteriota bacterium]